MLGSFTLSTFGCVRMPKVSVFTRSPTEGIDCSCMASDVVATLGVSVVGSFYIGVVSVLFNDGSTAIDGMPFPIAASSLITCSSTLSFECFGLGETAWLCKKREEGRCLNSKKPELEKSTWSLCRDSYLDSSSLSTKMTATLGFRTTIGFLGWLDLPGRYPCPTSFGGLLE